MHLPKNGWNLSQLPLTFGSKGAWGKKKIQKNRNPAYFFEYVDSTEAKCP